MAPRYFANSRTRLETLRNNPRLHLIGPTTVAQTRFNNLHTTQSPSSIRHNHLQQKCWRQISDQSNPTGIHQINGTGTALTLDAAFLNTPERFVHKPPKPPKIPTAVWINPPKQTEETQA
jgi:hypothetical protein